MGSIRRKSRQPRLRPGRKSRVDPLEITAVRGKHPDSKNGPLQTPAVRGKHLDPKIGVKWRDPPKITVVRGKHPDPKNGPPKITAARASPHKDRAGDPWSKERGGGGVIRRGRLHRGIPLD